MIVLAKENEEISEEMKQKMKEMETTLKKIQKQQNKENLIIKERIKNQ